MKVSFIVPARDKAKHVGACVRSVLAQTYSPMELVFSDQESQDETLDIILDEVARYDGPNTIRVLQCPIVERRGMPGLNDHLNWLDTQIEGDIVIMCSADDLNHPERVAHTVQAFACYNPSYVNTEVTYVDPEGGSAERTWFPDKRSRWIGIEEAIAYSIGASGSSAWSRDLYQKYAPLLGYEQQDLILPMMALLERGIYYVDLPLHTYIKHADLNNTGFLGQIRAATSEKQKSQLAERNIFAHVRNWTSVLARWQAAHGGVPRNVFDATMSRVFETGFAWAGTREALMMNGVSPL